ncbi:MAG TPA: Ig-like domain-containing protein [Gemmatimonadales bacterium]|nr:Ig-like domain-containing protein [Gemmatimonadales bacterium]
MTRFHAVSRWLWAVGALAACTDPVAPPLPSTLTVVQGVQEISVPGQRLDTILVRLTDARGNGVPGWRVEWSGDGTVVPVDTVTDALGQASAVWTLPRDSVFGWFQYPAGPSGRYSMVAAISDFGEARLATQARAFTADRVEAAGNVACALRGVELWCWGSNLFIPEHVRAPVKVALPAGLTITKLKVGDDIICVLDQAGMPWCMSRDAPNSLVPMAGAPTLLELIVIGSPWTDGVVCGRATTDRQVWCWTQAAIGRGVATRLDDTEFTTIDGGDGFGCGLDPAGEPWCWQQSRVGIGPFLGPFPPMRVAGTPPLVSLSVGDRRACGSAANGDVWCWDLRLVRDGSVVPAQPGADWIRGPEIMVGYNDEIIVPTPTSFRFWSIDRELPLSPYFAGYGITQFSGYGSICFKAASSEIFCSYRLVYPINDIPIAPGPPIAVPDPISKYNR